MLGINQRKILDLDGDRVKDISVKLKGISENNRAELYIKIIEGKAVIELKLEEEVDEEAEEIVGEAIEEKELGIKDKALSYLNTAYKKVSCSAKSLYGKVREYALIVRDYLEVAYEYLSGYIKMSYNYIFS